MKLFREFADVVRVGIYLHQRNKILAENDSHYEKMLWELHERHCVEHEPIAFTTFVRELGLYDTTDIKLFRHKLERLDKWAKPNPLYEYPVKRSFS